jgi:hypothetical protein
MGYWETHGYFLGLIFLLGIACLPRLTMLFAVSTPFGCLAWLGWVFAPHLLVAILATSLYWHTNPVLCVLAWIWALVGTGAEGKYAQSKAKKK